MRSKIQTVMAVMTLMTTTKEEGNQRISLSHKADKDEAEIERHCT